MSRRAAAIVLSQSPATFASLRANHCLPPMQSGISRLHSFKKPGISFFSSGSSCSSPDDDLNGLVDPEFSPPWNGACRDREDCRGASVSPKDFAFLQEAIAERDALPGKTLDSGKFSEEAILIAKAVRASGGVFNDKTEKFLRQFRGKLDESLVIEVLRLVKVPEFGVKFFIWAGRQIGYSHTGPTYDVLIEILGFDKKTRVPQHFLKEIGGDDREVLGRMLNTLVRKCCRNGFWNEALEELGRLKDFGYRPSKVTYNALIQVLLSADRLDSAFLVHREMSDSGFSVDRFTMGCFAHSLCKAGRWVEALNIIVKEDFTLDTVLCTQMISGLLEASLFEEAMSFLHRMRSNSCIPNVVTYRTLLSGFLRKKQLGWCKRIINMMITEGCNPNPSLFNSLVHAYCNSGDYTYAYKLLKKMSACGCRPGYVTYNIFIGGICGNEELPSSELMDLAEKAYEEMLDAGFVLNKINVSNFARCLCGMEKFEKAFRVIKEVMKRGFVPDTSTYSKVIGLLCQAHKVEKAFLLFQEMKMNGIVPDVYTYTILIDSFCKVGLIQQAQSWFNEMKRDGCTPNVVTYTALIHAYLKAKRLSEANELFESMISMGCHPNVVTYTALIDGFCKAGEIDKACHIYSKMRGNYEDPDTKTSSEGDGADVAEPNVITYGALVDGLCKAHKVAEAHDLLDAMSSAGCEPNHVVYDALIDGFCKAGRLDVAQEIFVRMSEHGFTPNVYTYSSLIDRLFKDRRLDLALKVLSKMLENSCAPNVVTYTEMIDGLCKAGKTEEAHKLLTMMEEKGCSPNVITYTALIDGFGKAAKVEMCLKLFSQMSKKGCSPNFITYRVLINHCCAAGLLDKAHELLEEMKQTYWPRYTADYSNMIQGFSRKFVISLGLLEEVAEYSSVPIAPAYSILIESYCRAGRLETALELHKEIIGMSSCSSIGNQNMYYSLIEALCLASKVEKAFELYSEMTRRGHVPELTVLFCLIKGLLRVNKWNEALQLCYCIYHHGYTLAESGGL
ncbi:pentatricopeptide repeat-containing protein At1g06710, mitochondrial isoform X1 [Phoenix dactylifera]|uniref:Pentatricopeptide repeat-containing protein At1g06710, mitochondrial isoform X1 n=1 Tax=Phoenix dactylifera TaxID=42345 RepID=A0A8B8J9X7_PHODC|nr:pentatricopeptide repeat-containing protein At1g06710, mitochondrial isoform X1 [Phoenix dactylifera]XP_026664428.1 pentatricopeptide repeat-containing protein At1g06710, mitochondrial isoform X1 [Phoenix dactylifera]XP_026664429.1 pentatricopeptide repeat-containing protein At1g06710, mitochondrial isoform X1 [Phoenix dactylifera]